MSQALKVPLVMFGGCGVIILILLSLTWWERAHPNPVRTYYGTVVSSDSTVTVNIHQCDGTFLLVLTREARVLPCGAAPSPSLPSQP